MLLHFLLKTCRELFTLLLKQQVKPNGNTARFQMCGMCEAHISDTVRKAFPAARKVSASRKSGEAVFLTEDEINTDTLKAAIEDTGYTFVSCKSEPYKKRGLFG